MCGIFGYLGRRNAVKTAIDGLKKLEYRGYDSAGIAGVFQGQIIGCKEVGKVEGLEREVQELDFQLESAIAHTRWATHGKPSQINAHPHYDNARSLALVHNGIIENHLALKKELVSQGARFVSETDTEVISHLIASLYKGDLLFAVRKAIGMLKGAFAFALIHKDFPDQIVVVGHESPLVIGVGEQEMFVSSDPVAFSEFTHNVVFELLQPINRCLNGNDEVAVVHRDTFEVFDAAGQRSEKKIEKLTAKFGTASKGAYEHYTLKEIFEQPQTIRSAYVDRLSEEFGTAHFEEVQTEMPELLDVERILILGCGTSWHAGYLGAYLFEDMARIPTQLEISSEYRYKNPLVPHRTLVIAISQSGETADTIAAVRELKAKGTNVHGSTLSRIADACINMRAGPEIGVCSTKAFTSQVVILSLLCLAMARMRNMHKEDGKRFITAIEDLSAQVEQILETAPHIEKIANKYAHHENFFFVGRRYMYPVSLEGALKLKEISYINANGYPAGELKHGAIALINENCPTVALCSNKGTYEKILSNIMEIKARNGPVIAIAESGQKGLEGIVDDIIWIPEVIDELAGIPATVATQLLAYYIARKRGTDIDKPRNLAKSVTVE